MCAAAYSISRAEQGRTGLLRAALAAVGKMSHSLRVKATEPGEPGGPDTACLIFTPPSRQSRSPTQRQAENDDTLLERDALLICRLGDKTDSAELKEEFHVPAVLNVI